MRQLLYIAAILSLPSMALAASPLTAAQMDKITAGSSNGNTVTIGNHNATNGNGNTVTIGSPTGVHVPPVTVPRIRV